MAIIDKRRVSDTKVKQGEVVGQVAGRDVVIFEDEISPPAAPWSPPPSKPSSVRAHARACRRGAWVLCGPAVEQLRAAEIESIVVTNTVSVPAEKHFDKLTVLTIAPLLAAAIERIHSGASVGALFE